MCRQNADGGGGQTQKRGCAVQSVRFLATAQPLSFAWDARLNVNTLLAVARNALRRMSQANSFSDWGTGGVRPRVLLRAERVSRQERHGEARERSRHL